MRKPKTIIIAEAGVNHNGDIKIAKKLVDIAKKHGADFIKFQAFKADLLTTGQLEISATFTVSLKLGLVFMPSLLISV